MKLEKLGLRSRFDFVLHLPLRYEDETTLTDPQQAPAGRPRRSRMRSTIARREANHQCASSTSAIRGYRLESIACYRRSSSKPQVSRTR